MASHDWATVAEYVSARSGALHRAAYLMVGDVGLAQDLVQEALIRTHAAWSRLRDHAKAEAYTRRAITTIAIDWSRRRARPGCGSACSNCRCGSAWRSCCATTRT